MFDVLNNEDKDFNNLEDEDLYDYEDDYQSDDGILARDCIGWKRIQRRTGSLLITLVRNIWACFGLLNPPTRDMVLNKDDL